MRLAVVSPFVDRRHGTERALAELLERLAAEYGCEIHLYAQRVENLRLAGPQPGRSSNSAGIYWHRVPSIAGPHVVQFIAWIFLNGFLRRWQAFLGHGSFDLVLSPGINCLHADVVIVHVLFHRLKQLSHEENERPGAQAGFLRKMHRRIYYGLLMGLERRIYSDPRVHLAAVSKRIAILLSGYVHRNDVSVIPNGVDTEYFTVQARLSRRAEARQRRGFGDNDFVLLLIGNDWRIKGLPTILDAMAAVSDSSLRLLVVGDDDAEPFRVMARRLGLEERCLWEHPRADVLELYAAVDAYVSPSQEDSFGLPVAEAMACGLPAITSIFAGVADSVRDGADGFVLPNPCDAQSLRELIERLRADGALRMSMGEAAAKTSQEWTWERNAAAVWQLLQDAAAKRLSSA